MVTIPLKQSRTASTAIYQNDLYRQLDNAIEEIQVSEEAWIEFAVTGVLDKNLEKLNRTYEIVSNSNKMDEKTILLAVTNIKAVNEELNLNIQLDDNVMIAQEGILDAIGNVVKAVVNSIGKLFSFIINLIKSFIKWLIELIRSLMGKSSRSGGSSGGGSNSGVKEKETTREEINETNKVLKELKELLKESGDIRVFNKDNNNTNGFDKDKDSEILADIEKLIKGVDKAEVRTRILNKDFLSDPNKLFSNINTNIDRIKEDIKNKITVSQLIKDSMAKFMENPDDISNKEVGEFIDGLNGNDDENIKLTLQKTIDNFKSLNKRMFENLSPEVVKEIKNKNIEYLLKNDTNKIIDDFFNNKSVEFYHIASTHDSGGEKDITLTFKYKQTKAELFTIQLGSETKDVLKINLPVSSDSDTEQIKINKSKEIMKLIEQASALANNGTAFVDNHIETDKITYNLVEETLKFIEKEFGNLITIKSEKETRKNINNYRKNLKKLEEEIEDANSAITDLENKFNTKKMTDDTIKLALKTLNGILIRNVGYVLYLMLDEIAFTKQILRIYELIFVFLKEKIFKVRESMVITLKSHKEFVEKNSKK